MRIQGPRDFDKSEPQVGARAPKTDESAPAAKTAGAGATVVLSQHASRATRLTEATEKKFADRVAELRAAIESGTYKVDTQRLADRIVDEECVK